MLFKAYDFTEYDAKFLEALIVNGMTEAEIAEKIYSVGMSTWNINLSREANQWVKKRVKNAIESATADCYRNLKKLADGFTVTEREFTAPFKVGSLEEHRKRLILALQDKRDKDFEIMVAGLIAETGEDKVKVRVKEIAPDYRANQLILQAHGPETWDLEGNRKKIPQVKIVVGLEGVDAKKMLKQKEVKPDYVVST